MYEFRETKIGEMHPVVRVDENVRGLYVPVNDSLLPSRLEPFRDLRGDQQRLLYGKPSEPADTIGQAPLRCTP